MNFTANNTLITAIRFFMLWMVCGTQNPIILQHGLGFFALLGIIDLTDKRGRFKRNDLF